MEVKGQRRGLGGAVPTVRARPWVVSGHTSGVQCSAPPSKCGMWHGFWPTAAASCSPAPLDPSTWNQCGCGRRTAPSQAYLLLVVVALLSCSATHRGVAL